MTLKTCGSLLAQENSERCDEYLKKLHATRRLTAFMASLAKRHSMTVAKTVVARLVSSGVLTDDEAKTIAASVERGPKSL